MHLDALRQSTQRAEDDLNALMEGMRGCFARLLPWLTARYGSRIRRSSNKVRLPCRSQIDYEK